jgi:hypothetical protein
MINLLNAIVAAIRAFWKPTVADALKRAGFAPASRDRIKISERRNRERLKRRPAPKPRDDQDP